MFTNLHWQDYLAIGVTIWAVWYVARRFLGVLRRDRRTGCGTCAGCGSAAKQQPVRLRAFVAADELTRRPPLDDRAQGS